MEFDAQHFTVTIRIPKPNRTWLRFRLRTALLILSLSGVALWWVIAPRRTPREFVAVAQQAEFAEARDPFDLHHFNEQSVPGPFTVAEFVSRSLWDLISGRQRFCVKRFYGDRNHVDNYEFVAGPLGVVD